jgi:NhaP-type Na+/H+ or K+/H+ antiporter
MHTRRAHTCRSSWFCLLSARARFASQSPKCPILLVGGSLFVDSWSWDAVALALFLFVVAPPVSVLIALLGTRTRPRIRGLIGWFGVRGIGSLYYLMYAIQHHVPEPLAVNLIQSTLIVVVLSIVLHGISVKPLMSLFWRRS